MSSSRGFVFLTAWGHLPSGTALTMFFPCRTVGGYTLPKDAFPTSQLESVARPAGFWPPPWQESPPGSQPRLASRAVCSPGGSTRRQKRLAPWTQVCGSGGALSFIVFPFRVPVLFPASSNPSTFYSFPNQPCGFFVFVLSYGHVLVLVLSRSVAPDSLRPRGL